MLKPIFQNISKVKYLFIVLLSTHSLQAQHLIIEKPGGATPEKEALFFLSKELVNPSYYKGDIHAVQKITTLFSPEGNITGIDTTTIYAAKSQKALANQLSLKSVIDRVGIDSIAKRSNGTYELYNIDAAAPYLKTVFILKGNKIIESYDVSATSIYKDYYTYDSNGRLMRIEHADDYNRDEYVLKIKYGKNGKMIHSKKVNNSDGTRVSLTNYVYKNGCLTEVYTTFAHYFFNQTELEIPVEDIASYDQYEVNDTYKSLSKTTFKYNAQNQITRVEKYAKGFSKSEGIFHEEHQVFQLKHLPNKLIVNASLPEKRRYEYQFDTLGNPIAIKSYVIKEQQEWLHKQTILKIDYVKKK